jgi:hypothetical protein
MTILGLLCSLALCYYTATSEEEPPHGMPYGKVGQVEVDQLDAFAKTLDVELLSDFKLAYEGNEPALARAFRFSLVFDSLDARSRTYNHLVYCTLLNLGETMGMEKYIQFLNRQPAEVQQRVRDILYYPMTQAPQKIRVQTEQYGRQMYPGLFPQDYLFAKQNFVSTPRSWAYWVHPSRWTILQDAMDGWQL